MGPGGMWVGASSMQRSVLFSSYLFHSLLCQCGRGEERWEMCVCVCVCVCMCMYVYVCGGGNN